MSDAAQSISQSFFTRRHLPVDIASLFFAVVALAWIGFAGTFIYDSSPVIEKVRYFFLFDDEMISMRYAANLAHGYGLVWNPHGARVEGFTNPLWVGIMTLFHLMPIPAARTSLMVELLCIALGVANLLFVWRLSQTLAPGSKTVALGAVILTAGYYPLNHWALRGSEVALLTPLLTLAVLLAIEMVDGGSPRWLWSVLGIGTLTRLDIVAPAIVIIAMVALYDRDRRRDHLVYGFGCLIVFVGAQLLLNRWYYGSCLPNTYYLKMTGYPLRLRIEHGLYMTRDFLSRIGPLILFLTVGFVCFKRDAAVLILAAVLGCIALMWVEMPGKIG